MCIRSPKNVKMLHIFIGCTPAMFYEKCYMYLLMCRKNKNKCKQIILPGFFLSWALILKKDLRDLH